MFKIISGDFSKNSICTFESILETGKGFETTKTLLKNAQEIRLLSDEEINQLIQNSDYALYIKDLKKAIKDDNTVCFYYKYKNKKEFTAIADLKTYQLVANKAKEEVPEEKLTTVSSSKNGCLFALVSILVLFAFLACIGGFEMNNANSNSQIENSVVSNSKPQLEILNSYNCSVSSYGGRAVCGTVINNTGKTFSYAQVEVNLYDKNGIQIGSTLDNINNLAPNAKWGFKAAIIDDRAASYKIMDVTGF